jgi:hypothetical protein
MGKSEDWIKRINAALVRKGWLALVSKGFPGRASVYTVVVPEGATDPEVVLKQRRAERDASNKATGTQSTTCSEQRDRQQGVNPPRTDGQSSLQQVVNPPPHQVHHQVQAPGPYLSSESSPRGQRSAKTREDAISAVCELIADAGPGREAITPEWLTKAGQIIDRQGPRKTTDMARYALEDKFWKDKVASPAQLEKHWDSIWKQTGFQITDYQTPEEFIEACHRNGNAAALAEKAGLTYFSPNWGDSEDCADETNSEYRDRRHRHAVQWITDNRDQLATRLEKLMSA